MQKLPPLPFKKESVGDYSAPGLQVKGAFIGTPLTVDAAFAAQHENTPPNEPFTVTVPKGKDIFFTPGGKKTGLPELVKLMTATKERQAVEILRLVNLSVPLQPEPADRLKLCARLLVTQALPAATKNFEKAALLDTYATKIGGYDAVCVHAQMTKPETGQLYVVKLVGILHPTRPGGVMAFLLADTKLSDIKDPADLASKGIGLQIIHSLRFVDAPPAAAPKP